VNGKYDDLSKFFEEEQQTNTRISFSFFLPESSRKEGVPEGTSRKPGVSVTVFIKIFRQNLFVVVFELDFDAFDYDIDD
jgi:hypothetical protein